MNELLTTWLSSESGQMFSFFCPRLLIAVLCGTLIGLEREIKGKAAGLRTCILICIGSTVYSSVSVLIFDRYGEGDPSRIVAQIVSGIGFLCGGVIIQSQGSVYGITTAAAIWLLAAIGVAVGMEFYTIALMGSILCLGVLVVARWFETKFTKKINQKHKIFWVEFSTTAIDQEMHEIQTIFKDLNLHIIELSLQKDSSKIHKYRIKTHSGRLVSEALSNKAWVEQVSFKPI